MPEPDAGYSLAVERVKDALLREYPWHTYDQWDGENAPKGSWPHLQHVAEVAASAVLDLAGQPQQAAAARALYQRLRQAEKGRNQYGPSWVTSEMVKALYAFYEEMEGPGVQDS